MDGVGSLGVSLVDEGAWGVNMDPKAGVVDKDVVAAAISGSKRSLSSLIVSST